MESTRLLPHDLEAERLILGNILLHAPALYQAREKIQPDDLYDEAHRLIYSAMLSLNDAQKPLDLKTIKDVLSQSGKLEKCGGPVYLLELLDGMPKSIAVDHYASIVHDHATRRRVIRAAHEAMTTAYDDTQPTKDIIEHLQLALLDLSRTEHGGWKPITDLVKESYEEIKRTVTAKNSLTGISSGFKYLDDNTRGFRGGELTILAGRPGHGKSAFAMNIVGNMVLRLGRSVGVFSLEMSGRELATRGIMTEAEVDPYEISRIDRYGLGKATWNRLHEACNSYWGRHLWIDDAGGLTIADLRSRAQRLKLEHGIDFLVVDYLQLMSGHGGRNTNREREISEISRGLKSLAKELDIPVMALSQLNRAIEHTDRKPILADLRESGSIEQDADLVLFVWREDMRSNSARQDGPGSAEILIGKQRSGHSRISLRYSFDGRYTKFAEVNQ